MKRNGWIRSSGIEKKRSDTELQDRKEMVGYEAAGRKKKRSDTKLLDKKMVGHEVAGYERMWNCKDERDEWNKGDDLVSS